MIIYEIPILSYLFFLSYLNLYSIILDSNFRITGTVRTKYEYNLDSNISAFVVRNARYQVSGYIRKDFEFKAEIDLSDEGRMRMLDAFVNWIPIDNLEITLGQMKVPFSTDNIRSPHEIAFLNRSFMSKRISSELRDIGVQLMYNAKEYFPFKIYLGLFNGTGINRPIRDENKNFALRGELDFIKDLNISACLYTGKLNEDNVFLYNFGFDYQVNNFVFDGEFAIRKTWTDTLNYDTFSYLFYILRVIPIDTKLFNYVVPGVRIDSYDRDYTYNDEVTIRITTGVTFVITKLYESHIRIDYENYSFKGLENQKLDKISVEFMARF